METNYFKNYSPALNRDMECKVYGHGGRPVLFIPCQDGRFYDFENFHMTDVWSPWIDSGQVTVFSIDTIDQETWSNIYGDAGWRSYRHDQWIRYITDEFVPFMVNFLKSRNQTDADDLGIIVTGCSLGATHAVNLYYRRPDLFDGLLALSGIYDSSYGFGNYVDDYLYDNCPLRFLSNMPIDHPYISYYNEDKKRAIICVGRGPWECPSSTEDLKYVLESKGIHAWVDFWGYDCSHDWEWWYKQVTYFVPYLLN